MESVSSTQSVEALGQILQAASKASVDQAVKLMKVAVEMAVGTEPGKGAEIDLQA